MELFLRISLLFSLPLHLYLQTPEIVLIVVNLRLRNLLRHAKDLNEVHTQGWLWGESPQKPSGVIVAQK